MRLSSNRLWLSVLDCGRRGRQLFGNLLVPGWAAIGMTSRLGGKRQAGEDGRW